MPSSKDTKRSKAPKIILPGTRRGSRLSATAPRKMSRSSPKAAPLAPGDPIAINTATSPGPSGDGNVIETNTVYQMGQEDRCVLVVQTSATIALPLEPLLGYPVFVVADGGSSTVTGPIQGGNQIVSQGSIGIFVYSAISGEWSTTITTATPISGPTVIVNHATGAVTMTSGETALVDTTTGSISTITLGGGVLGTEYEVNDYGCEANINNITVSPGVGMQLEDPNSPGVYQTAGTACVFATPGQFCQWKFDGTSKYKIKASGT